MPRYQNAAFNAKYAFLAQLSKHTTPRTRRIILANLFCILLFIFAVAIPKSGKGDVRKDPTLFNPADFVESPDEGLGVGEVYYISKRALCSRSIAHGELGIQPIAVSKVILRPVEHDVNATSKQYDDRLEVLEDAMINDVAFLDRNVSGKDAELGANICPMHTVTILPQQKPRKYSASQILFAVTMPFEEIPMALQHWKYWANKESDVNLFILLPSSEANRVQEAREMTRSLLGIKVHVESDKDDDDFGKLTLKLVERMRKVASFGTEWFIILSASTFVTSVEDILLALEPYDSEDRMYMGGLSESTAQKEKHGLFAYGGAGIVLSKPLVDSLIPNLPKCLKIEDTIYGDGLLSMCIGSYTIADFTILPTFHQCDIEEDITGLFQGPLEFATLYNLIPGSFTLFPPWHSVGPESNYPSTFADQIELFHKARKILSPQNWGIRYRFGQTGRYLLTNGYSVTEFLRPPYPTNHDIRNAVEGTFANENDAEEFTFHASHGRGTKEIPVRLGLREGGDKRTYYLRAIEFKDTQASVARVKKMNRNRKQAAVFVYVNEWGNVRRGIEVVWLL